MLRKRLISLMALGMSVALGTQVVSAQATPLAATPIVDVDEETTEPEEVSSVSDIDPTDEVPVSPEDEVDPVETAEPGPSVEEPTEPIEPTEEPEEPGESEAPAEEQELLNVLSESPTALEPMNVSPMAEGVNGCSYADPGTGAYASTLCWLDFTGFTTAYRDRGVREIPRYVSVLDLTDGPFEYTVRNSSTNLGTTANPSRWGHIQNYPVEADLGGGFVLRATLNTSSEGGADAKALISHSFPTWNSAFLGNTLNGQSFYTGVTGEPALYNERNLTLFPAGRSILELTDIRVFNGDQEVRDYSIVVADAETTDSTESIQWTTTGRGFTWLPNTPPGTGRTQVMGNACTQSFTPALNAAASSSASCASNSNSFKTGTPMLATAPPANTARQFNVSQNIGGNGRQGVAFGVIMARASVEVSVDDRIVDSNGNANDGTVFNASISAGGAGFVSATTGSSNMTSGPLDRVLPVTSTGTALTFASSATGGNAESYVASWQCTKDDPSTGVTSYWPTKGTSPTPPDARDSFSVLKPAEFISCKVTYTPPYLTLKKAVDLAGTEANDGPSAFELTATGQDLATSQFWGPGGSADVEKRPVSVGTYEITETANETMDWQYGYDWTGLACDPAGGGAARNVTLTPQEGPVLTSGAVEVDQGDDLVCTLTNAALEPHLDTMKEAFDSEGNSLEWGGAVNPGNRVFYKLTFDNSTGTAPMEISYIDHLADVLDDADFDVNSIRIFDGSEESDYPDNSITDPGITVTDNTDNSVASSPTLGIEGTVARAEVRTVWFSVTVKANETDALVRETGVDRAADSTKPNLVGYALNNYLVNDGDPVPGSCDEPVNGGNPSCTHHPVPAWSVSKNARPAGGALLHVGGNSHYQLTATKMNSAAEINDLVFIDDLTHVFKSAGWAPDAAVPGGALPRGIYFFNENNESLDENGLVNGTAVAPEPAYDATSGKVPEPQQVDGRWILKSVPVDVPAQAERAEMWFAVQAGQSPTEIPGTEALGTEEMKDRQYTNYVTASSNGLNPNMCATGTTSAPDTTMDPFAETPYDPKFPEGCRVTNGISANYFTIRKDASGSGAETSSDSIWGDPTGLTNLVGHEFQIQDDDGNGAPTGNPSKYLCRAEYAEADWDGTFAETGTPDWVEDSATLQAIVARNRGLDPEDQLPLCATFYAQGTYGGQEHAGGQDGRWRAENLPAGNYWLFETKAPVAQVDNVTGQQTRPVEGVQLLAEPIPFKIWQEGAAEKFGATGQSQHGNSQLDVIAGEDSYLDRCSPGEAVGDRPVACVNPTGFLMIVKDSVPLTLPFSGGGGTVALTAGGVLILLVTLAGAWWWRRRDEADFEATELTERN